MKSYKIGQIFFALLYALSLLSPVKVLALSSEQKRLLNSGVYYFNSEDDSQCNTITTVGQSVPKKLYLLGDSIAHLGEQKIKNIMASPQYGFQFTGYNADSGRAISKDTAGSEPSGIDAADADKALIAAADAVVIELGTNSGTEDLNTQIPALITKVRQAKKDTRIFWINLFYTNDINSRTNRNKIIEEQAKTDKQNYTVIDMLSGNIETSDGTHPTDAGNDAFAKLLAEKIISSSPGSTSAGDNGMLGKAFPRFDNEAAMGAKMTDFIRSKAPGSPFLTIPGIPDVGQWIVAESKARNINPFFIIATGYTESRFGTSGSAPKQNNFFGWTSGSGGYRAFASPREGIEAFINQIRDNLYNNGVGGRYMSVNNMYEYTAIHQSGTKAYPGENLDPNDQSGPGGRPDGDRLNGFDPIMNVYISWTISDHPNNRYDGQLFNPLIYHRNNVEVVNAITGLHFDPEHPQKSGDGAINNCTGASTNPARGEASKYIPDCSANEGNAAIACTAINQLMGIPYSQAQRAAPTDPDPKFLDCSALTGMAVYRTFGVNLGGICSAMYKSNPNFRVLENIRDIQPGDLIGHGTSCGDAGHIAVVVSYNPSTKKLITVEASGTKYPSGLRGIGGPNGYNVGLEVDGNGGYSWAVRYIGQKVLQPGAG